MSLTVVLNIQSIALPQITNPIRVDVATQDNPTAIVASQTDTTAGHPAKIWSFPGLPRTNYVVTMNEISGGAPVNQLAYFDVVPDNIGNLVRDDEQLTGGVTPGFDVGLRSVMFDGHDVALETSDYALHQYITTDVWAWSQSFQGTPVIGDTTKVHFLVNGLNQYVNVDYTASFGNLTNYLTEIGNQMTAMDSRVVVNVITISGYPALGVTVQIGNTTSGDVTITHGTGNTVSFPDYRGWNINPERRAGGGTMQRDVEYSWDKDTGEFKWLQLGDGILPNELYNIDFDPIEGEAGGSVPPPAVVVGFSTRLITASGSITANDLGNNIIVEPASTYLELTLPDVSTMADGKPVTISVYKTAICCVKIVGNVKFEYGTNMFLIAGESVELYCFIRSAGNNEWRYRNANAAFNTVGSLIYGDYLAPNVAVPAIGVQCDINTHARLWQWVQTLSPNSVVPFLNWGTNRTFFSLKNPSGTGFYAPDRTHLYSRCAASSENVGTYMAQQISAHKHLSPFNPRDNAPFGKSNFTNKFGDGSSTDNDNDFWFTNDGTEIAGGTQMNPANLIGGETRPNSFLTNLYIQI